MNPRDEFLAEGMECYPAAAQAVWEFERELEKRIQEYVDARRDWGPVQGTKRGQKATSGSPRGGWSIGWYASGTIGPDPTKFYVGYWWNAPGVAPKFRAAVAVGLESGPAEMLASVKEGAAPEIASVEWGKTYLLAPLGDDLGPAVQLDMLFEALFAVMKKAL